MSDYFKNSVSIPERPEYSSKCYVWNKIDDCLNGEDAIKSSGELYLRKTPGMRNDDVKEFQTYLRVIGQNIGQIPVIEATGYFGPETERAVMTFQRLYGIEPTGVVGALTWDTAAKEYNFIRFGTERTG